MNSFQSRIKASLGAILLAAGALFLVASMSGCKRVCRQAEREVFVPTQKLVQGLRALETSEPDQERLRSSCEGALGAIAKITDQSRRVESLISKKLKIREQVCQNWRSERRFVCRDLGFPGYERRGPNEICYWTQERYCGDWDWVTIYLPQYDSVTRAFAASHLLNAQIVQECSSIAPSVQVLVGVAQKIDQEVVTPYQRAFNQVCQ